MRRYGMYVFLVVLGFIYFFFFHPKFLIEDYKFKDIIFNLFEKRQVVNLDNDLVVIDIDLPSLRSYQCQYPVNRKLLALVLSRLRKAKEIVLTIPIQGASGTAGDDALIKVLRSQKNVVIPIGFSELGSNFGGVVNAGKIFWLPWKRIVRYVMVGGVNFFIPPTNNAEGFYPFFSYRGKIIPHLLTKMFSLSVGFDENVFSYSPRWNTIKWQAEGKRVSLPLDYYNVVSISPGLDRYLNVVKARSISVKDILPVSMYKKYLYRGVDVPPDESVENKICIVGCMSGPNSAFLPFGDRLWPLHYMLCAGLMALRKGMILYCPPIWLQGVLLFLISLVIGCVVLVRPRWILVILPFGLLLCGLLWIWALQHGIFLLGIEWISVIAGTSIFSAVLGKRNEIIERHSMLIEKKVVKEIKERTTYLPGHRDWLDIRVKEIVGEEVGGSMYDFIEIAQDRIGLAIGDVMDHGKEALTKISYLRGFLRSHSIITHQPGEVVYSINKALVKATNMGMSCKFLYVLLDATRNRVVFSGAGGVSFILLDRYRKQVKCYEVEERIPLGISREIFYEPKEISIQKGDILLFYTPSILNLRNSEGKTYDVDRLGKAILANAKQPLKILLNKIAEDITRFSSIREDIALIGVEWKKEPIETENDNLFVGISSSERELLLFYKRMNQKKTNKR